MYLISESLLYLILNVIIVMVFWFLMGCDNACIVAGFGVLAAFNNIGAVAELMQEDWQLIKFLPMMISCIFGWVVVLNVTI